MSVVLYVAIIAIWLFILVPRWLRRSHEAAAAKAEQDRLDEAAALAAAEAAAAADDAGPVTEPISRITDADAPAGTGAAARAPAAGPARRSRVLQARRRLLTILVLLNAIAAASVLLRLTRWWACVPEIIMLGLYLLLLREASAADSGRAGREAALARRALAERERARVERELEQEAVEQHTAQIIDISARVGDQLYDQYADATVRAVGD